MSHKVVVKVAADGKVTVSVQGLAGASCTDVTRAVEAALGEKTDEKRTPEFFQRADNAATLRQGS